MKDMNDNLIVLLVLCLSKTPAVQDFVRVEELSYAANQMIVQAQSQGLQPPKLSDLPIQAMYQTPRLALWFTAENGTVSRYGLDIQHDANSGRQGESKFVSSTTRTLLQLWPL